MSTSEYDSYRPPELDRGRKKRRRGGRGGGQGWKNRGADGNREMPMVEDVEFSSYYGRPIVKAPPWGDEIAIYLFLGGLAGGSSLLGLGAQLSDRPQLRIATRLTAITATGVGGVALVADLGRPERFLNMMRVFKVSSPMSMGTWILSGFGVGSGVLAAIEADRLTGQRLPLGPLRRVLHAMETPAAFESALFATPLAAYTGALLGDTAVPTWNAAGRNGLSYVFVSSAAVAAGGVAMALAPVRETGPARLLALTGAAGEAFAMNRMKQGMHPTEVDPMEEGEPGHKLHRAEKLLIAGAIGAAAVEVGARVFAKKLGKGAVSASGERSWKTRAALRAVSVVGGAALAAASAYTRFGVLEAGLESTKDPRHVVEPQRARLEERRARGVVDDSITTGV
ncbi:NrfD/PsrC family molybdoenzyme membrane anchor subunit [Brevibacterium zhoupengii]|uniref:NrfD/PsrC family molybdoenzyme membrane anchor subunit n=1 Tax=Brevibacterium zhoupengii TaxID=2898795 RepID=UPI001F09C5F1|nr:NrfD/PsrC family molybdoenzyme membrane anchor subunit [Brevibacterium zhoupengii]